MTEKSKNDTTQAEDWRPVLLPGEKILWEGQPVPGVTLEWLDIYVIPFSIFWFLGILSMIFVPGQHRGDWIVPLPMSFVLVPFIVIGMHISFGRFLLQYYQYYHTRYFITNVRVHTLTKTRFRYHDSFLDLSQIPVLVRQHFHSQMGDILFERYIAGRPSVGFYRLSDASEVYQLLVVLTSHAGTVLPNLQVTGKTSNTLYNVLLEDEKILWCDKPVTGWIFGLNDILLFPVCLVIGGIQIGAGVNWYLSGNPSSASLPGSEWTPLFWRYFGVIAVLIGVYLIFGQYLHRYFRKRHIEYAITNRRIIGLNGNRVWSLPLNPLLRMKKRLTGILLEPKLVKPVPVLARGKIEIDPLELQPGFYGIQDSIRVYNLIRLAIRMQPPPAVPK